MRAHAPTLAVFSILSLAIVAATQAAPRQDLTEPTSADAQAIVGSADIVDGDSIKINGVAIRLHGIDAAEMAQTCAAAPSATRFMVSAPSTWNCGLDARRALARLIGHSEVSCVETTIDKYGRTVARCRAGEKDLGAEMVRQGHAWAFVRYSTDYVEIEKEARAARRGIWQADTRTAWDFRAGMWDTAQATAPDGCTIKGNVTWTGERIYHLPWSPWYATVKMDTASSHRKGKRWFCSEAEALAAGWRPSATR